MISVSSATDGIEWDRFVRSHPLATGYHLWAWRDVFQRAFGHTCEYLIARQDGHVTGVLPLVNFRTWLFGRFSVSLPFVNYGGVLTTSEESARALLERASERARFAGQTHTEFRHRQRMFSDLPVKQHKVAMLLPLAPSADAMWERFDRKVRNQVRKAQKSDLTIDAGGTDLLPAFYSVFTENMRDLGTPVYSRRFFTCVLEAFPDNAHVHVVRSGGQPIAGAISFGYGSMLEVPWASSLKAFRSCCPNHLLYWTIIAEAIEKGFETFDFGRSTPDEGTFQFKRQWGAEPHPLYWEYQLGAGGTMPDQSPKNPRFRWAIETWKRLPLRLTQMIGPPIVRCIP